jgi:uncharacterized RDD family membrane protein YckC
MNVVANALPEANRTTAYGGIVTRAVGFAIDVAIVQAILFLIGVVVALIVGAFSTFNLDGDVETILGAATAWALAFSIYCAAFWSLTGQTFGMRAMGIEVTAGTGERLSLWHSLVRLVGMVLAAIPLFLGYLPILLRDDRRGLHDLLARSVVRYADDKRPPRPQRGTAHLPPAL